MAELRPSIARFRDAGAELAVIGTGNAAMAKAFREDAGIPDISVYTDEARKAYGAAGFHRGIWPLLQPRAVSNYIRAFLAGYQSGRLQGDALQQGGVLVINPEGVVLYRHASRSSGDHADVGEILSALRPASAQIS